MRTVKIKDGFTTYLPGREFKAGETYEVNDDEYEALVRAEVVDSEPEPKKKKKSD